MRAWGVDRMHVVILLSFPLAKFLAEACRSPRRRVCKMAIASIVFSPRALPITCSPGSAWGLSRRPTASSLAYTSHFSLTGKYAVRGYPHKLGLLLHGPPGTGKTSLIKALACHTGRHIVTVPLGRVETNQVTATLLSAVGRTQLPVCRSIRRLTC